MSTRSVSGEEFRQGGPLYLFIRSLETQYPQRNSFWVPRPPEVLPGVGFAYLGLPRRVSVAVEYPLSEGVLASTRTPVTSPRSHPERVSFLGVSESKE